ncbi:Hypothetical protein FKW44_007933, partial [Caligus rogercresseyi]
MDEPQLFNDGLRKRLSAAANEGMLRRSAIWDLYPSEQSPSTSNSLSLLLNPLQKG